jgi:hypothetical protein
VICSTTRRPYSPSISVGLTDARTSADDRSVAYSLLRKSKRKDERVPATGLLRMLWQDETGRERLSQGQLVDISASGLSVRVDHIIPARTYVSCNDPDLGISGRGSIRYCNFSRGKYRIGVEFGSGTGWYKTPKKQSDVTERNLAGQSLGR